MSRSAYISGPITGMENGNERAFSKAQRKLYDEYGCHFVVNPQEWFEGAEDDAAFKGCIRILLDTDFDFIYMLPGWENSKGAVAEKHLAERLGIEVVYSPSAKDFNHEEHEGHEGMNNQYSSRNDQRGRNE